MKALLESFALDRTFDVHVINESLLKCFTSVYLNVTIKRFWYFLTENSPKSNFIHHQMGITESRWICWFKNGRFKTSAIDYVGFVKWSNIVLQWIISRVRIPNIKIQMSRKESCAVEASGTRDHGLYFCIILHGYTEDFWSAPLHLLLFIQGVSRASRYQRFVQIPIVHFFGREICNLTLLSGLRLEISS